MRRRWILLIELCVLVIVCVVVGLSLVDRTPRPANAIDIKVQMRDAHDRVFLSEENGRYVYTVTRSDGTQEKLTPEQFSGRIYEKPRGWLSTLLNVSSPIGLLWVSVGFLGQVLFTGRMVVQWLVSEKTGRSVVPPVFWWMSLIGSTMLLVYFLWRLDPIGLLGQGFGWFIYVRNLWLIYGNNGQRPAAGEDPGPEPELAERK